MTTNKPDVVGYIDEQEFSQRVGHAPFLHPTPNRGYTVPLIRLSDYEILQAECDKLRKDAELWESIHDEIHRRADKEHALADKCDFNVTIMYDDYAAIDTAIKGETE